MDVIKEGGFIEFKTDNDDLFDFSLGEFTETGFTLEDVRMTYELIRDCGVDKSNFRKKIIKYCEKVNETVDKKSGYRPSQRYKFKPLKGDVWL